MLETFSRLVLKPKLIGRVTGNTYSPKSIFLQPGGRWFSILGVLQTQKHEVSLNDLFYTGRLYLT